VSAQYERELIGWLRGEGFYAVRVAGSHQLDILATHPERGTVIVEVKSTKNASRWYVNGTVNRQQYEDAYHLAQKGHRVLYGVRFKSGPREGRWQFYHVSPGHPAPSPMRREEGQSFWDAFDDKGNR